MHSLLTALLLPYSLPVSDLLHQLLQLIIVIIPPATPPVHHNFLLLFFILFRDRAQNLLELLLRHLLPYLSGAREHDEPVLDVGGARFFDEPDPAEAVGGVGGQYLGEDVVALVRWGVLVVGLVVVVGQGEERRRIVSF